MMGTIGFMFFLHFSSIPCVVINLSSGFYKTEEFSCIRNLQVC